MTRTAIVTAATGHGHLAAARALAEATHARGGTAVILDIGAHPFLRALVGFYNLCLRRDPRWMGAFFAAVNGASLDRLAFRPVRRWADGFVARANATAFLSVHPMVNHGLAETLARTAPDVPFAVGLTDLAPPLWRGWAEPRAAAVTAPSVAAAEQLAAWGVPPERIVRAPIPTRAAFRPPSAGERRAARRALGLAEDRLTVVLNAGTAQRPAALRAFRALATASDLAGSIQAVFLAGGNPRLLRRAARVRPPFPAAVLSWRDDPEAVLAAADVLFTKPGGLTAAEALAAGVPLLVDACGGVMPQERGNARWIAAVGAGWIVDAPEQVSGLVRAAAAAGPEALRARARAAAGGGAAAVLDAVAGALGPRRVAPRAGAHGGPVPALAAAPGGEGTGA